MSDKEYIIFSDESVKKGGYFSNFYGGVMVGSSQYNRITQSLNALKDALGFHGEVKWSKVTDQYLDRYLALMDAYFDEIAEGHLRVRVMFTKNSLAPANLTAGPSHQKRPSPAPGMQHGILPGPPRSHRPRERRQRLTGDDYRCRNVQCCWRTDRRSHFSHAFFCRYSVWYRCRHSRYLPGG